MSSPAFRSVFKKMQNRKLITPYLDMAVTQSNWPMSYNVRIDSAPYYGLNEDGSPDGYFHPSTHSLLGSRLLWYMVHPLYRDKLEKEPPSLQREMTFAMGSALHGVVQTQFQMIGLCAPNVPGSDPPWSPDIEVEYTNEEHNARGRNDFTVHHPTEGVIPVELKTMNTIGFKKLDDTVESMKPEWRAQLSMALDNLGYAKGILLVFQAGWPYRFEEIPYTREDSLLSEIYGRFDEASEHLALDSPPPHCCSYNSSTMKACPAKRVCWLAEGKTI